MIETLKNICEKILAEKGLNDEKHQKRLALELKEIEAQNEGEYFLDLYNKKVKYAENQHNLLVPYLLGIVSEVDIEHEPVVIYGDWPDCDVDLLPIVRDYL